MGLCGIVRCCSFCRVIICVPLIAHSADLGDAVPAGQDKGMKDHEGGAVVVAASVEPSMSTLSESLGLGPPLMYRGCGSCFVTQSVDLLWCLGNMNDI